MPSLHDECESPRPCKVERERDRVDEVQLVRTDRRQIDGVLAEHRCHDVAVGAGRCRIDFRLIVLQAHPEPGLTHPGTLASDRVHLSTATLPFVVLTVVIVKIFQSQLEQSGALDLIDEYH